MTRKAFAILTGAAICLVLGVLVNAEPKKGKQAAKEEEHERKVKEAEVPKAALDALKKQAGGAKLTEFSEEVEHGKTYYEGSYNGKNGNVDVLVTPTGDLVEIEETVPADSVPHAVADEVKKSAGADAKAHFEKKTIIMYEAHFKKDGRGHEIVMAPDGRVTEREEKGGDGDKDEDE